MTITTKKTWLALSIALASQSVFALDAMTDENMSEVAGQDGIQIRSAVSSVDMERLYWQDGAVAPTTLDLRWDTVNITPTSGLKLESTTQLNFGASAGGTPAVYFKNITQPFRLKTQGIRVANNSTGTDRTFGVFALETTTPSTFTYFNTNGLFDGTSSSGKMTFDIQNSNWYLAMPQCFYASCALSAITSPTSTSSIGVSQGSGAFAPNGLVGGSYNLLAFKNLNLKGSMTGKFDVNATTGLSFDGTLALPRINSSTNGFQVQIGVQSNVASANVVPSFNFAAASSIKPYWQFGFSGDLLNTKISLKGDNTTALTTANTTGLKISAQTEFAKTGANAFMVEMGEPFGVAGSSPYTIQFKNWVPLSDGSSASATPAVFKFGDAYINLLAPNSTLANFALNPDQVASRNPFSGVVFGSITTPNVAGENAFSQALRGFELQAYPTTIGFNDGTTVTDNSWALMPLFYGFNSNLVLYPSGHPNLAATNERRGVGFDWKVETLARANADGSACTTTSCVKGTHFLVADTTAKKYVGLRNISGRYSFGQGQLYAADATTDGVEGLMLRAKNLEIDMDAEFAVGDLPNGTTVTGIRNDDEYFGLRLKLAGDFKLAFSPAPAGQSYIGLSGAINMTDGSKNSITLTEPNDGTKLQFANITGLIKMNPEHVVDGNYEDASRIDLGVSPAGDPLYPNKPFISFAAALEIAPGTGNNDVLRVRDVNLIQGANTYRLGEIVMTGGRIYSQLDIRPQN